MRTSEDDIKRFVDESIGKAARVLDDGMLWVRPARLGASQQQSQWWPGLEQQIRDFHAQYERACFED